MAESFSAAWLALREPVDHRARPDDLLPPLRAWLGERGSARLVDLGSGTGSNLRYLAPRLDTGQHWRLVDHDAGLLARAEASGGRVQGVARLETVRGDLAREGIEAVAGADLVTGSALLDLVSMAWLDRLVAGCAAAGSAALFALSWDGAIGWDTPDPDDALVTAAVGAHQRRDKGMGPALGPLAGPAASDAFTKTGHSARLVASPWVIGPDERALALALIDGWEAAAVEQQPADEARVRAWAERRRRTAGSDAFRLIVGHWDLLALPER